MIAMMLIVITAIILIVTIIRFVHSRFRRFRSRVWAIIRMTYYYMLSRTIQSAVTNSINRACLCLFATVNLRIARMSSWNHSLYHTSYIFPTASLLEDATSALRGLPGWLCLHPRLD